MMCIDNCAIIGSCNWTTASRANSEVGVLVGLCPAGQEQLEKTFDGWMTTGVVLRVVVPDDALP
eukprot:14696564-Alexandrium_andersonii.AAC.1